MTGENRRVFSKEETTDYAVASSPEEQAPINIPNSNGEAAEAQDSHGHPTNNVKEERTPSVPYVRRLMLEDIQVWKSQLNAPTVFEVRYRPPRRHG